MMLKNDILSFVPQVLSDGIVLGARGDNNYLNNGLFKILDYPELTPGRELKIPTRTRVGEFQPKAEAQPMASDTFTTDHIMLIPEVYALSVGYSFEAVKSYMGDLAQDIINDLKDSYLRGVDAKAFNIITSIDDSNDFDKSTETISLQAISELIAMNRIADRSKYRLFVSYDQIPAIENLKDGNGNLIFQHVANGTAIEKGFQGYLLGIKVIADTRIVPQTVEGVQVFENYLVQEEAIAYARASALDIEIVKDAISMVYTVCANVVEGMVALPDKTIARAIFKK